MAEQADWRKLSSLMSDQLTYPTWELSYVNLLLGEMINAIIV